MTLPWYERRRLVRQLEDVHGRYTRAARLAGALGTLDEYLATLAAVADFNRAHPEMTIPKMIDGRVPAMPMLAAPGEPA